VADAALGHRAVHPQGRGFRALGQTGGPEEARHVRPVRPPGARNGRQDLQALGHHEDRGRAQGQGRGKASGEGGGEFRGRARGSEGQDRPALQPRTQPGTEQGPLHRQEEGEGRPRGRVRRRHQRRPGVVLFHKGARGGNGRYSRIS